MSKHLEKYVLYLLSFLLLILLSSFQTNLVKANETVPQYPPSSPDFWFDGDSSSKTSVLLEWSEVSNSEGYRIYQKQGEQFVLLADVDADTQSWIWNDLECGKSYEFVVNAYNSFGESTPLAVKMAYTWECDCSDYEQNEFPVGFSDPFCGGELKVIIDEGCNNLSFGNNQFSSVSIPQGWNLNVYDLAPDEGPQAYWNQTMWDLTSDLYWQSDVSTNDTISFICATAPLDNFVFLPLISR